MGNKSLKDAKNSINEIIYKKKSANSSIGKIATCPNCNKVFDTKTTYHTVTQFISFIFSNL